MVFSVVIHQEESGFVGRCRELPEIIGAGETLEECCTKVREAFIAYFQEHGPTALESSALKVEGSHRGYAEHFSLN
jgi:predicted RNase H-like HicB family nuclease